MYREPERPGWYYARVRVQNAGMDHQHSEIEFAIRLWFNRDALKSRWWIGDEPGICVALHKAIPGATVIDYL